LELAALRTELEQCRTDLANDEEIFGEKVAELREVKREVKRAKRECERLAAERDAAAARAEAAETAAAEAHALHDSGVGGSPAAADGGSLAMVAENTQLRSALATATAELAVARAASGGASNRARVIAELEAMDDVLQCQEDDSSLMMITTPVAPGAAPRAPANVPRLNLGTERCPRCDRLAQDLSAARAQIVTLAREIDTARGNPGGSSRLSQQHQVRVSSHK
jgi:hypothetical protein